MGFDQYNLALGLYFNNNLLASLLKIKFCQFNWYSFNNQLAPVHFMHLTYIYIILTIRQVVFKVHCVNSFIQNNTMRWFCLSILPTRKLRPRLSEKNNSAIWHIQEVVEPPFIQQISCWISAWTGLGWMQGHMGAKGTPVLLLGY
jgi:hypothetical protein